MNKKIVKLAIIRKNDSDPCPFGLEIPIACESSGDLVDRMSPVRLSSDEAQSIVNSNQHLFIWKNPGQRCKYAGKIPEEETKSVECNWNSTAPGEEGTPIVGSPWYTKHFSGIGLDGVYTFPLGYYADNSIDRGMYYGMYSIESVASKEDSEEDSDILLLNSNKDDNF